jgi:cytochrome bd-type quinol oxidase subunit 2
MITSPSSLSLLSSSSAVASSSPLLGTHTMLAVTSLTLYDAAAPHGVVTTAVAGAVAGTVTALVQRRQQLPSSSFVPRSALRHGAFFTIYRSLYPTTAPPQDRADVHAT